MLWFIFTNPAKLLIYNPNGYSRLFVPKINGFEPWLGRGDAILGTPCRRMGCGTFLREVMIGYLSFTRRIDET